MPAHACCSRTAHLSLLVHDHAPDHGAPHLPQLQLVPGPTQACVTADPGLALWGTKYHQVSAHGVQVSAHDVWLRGLQYQLGLLATTAAAGVWGCNAGGKRASDATVPARAGWPTTRTRVAMLAWRLLGCLRGGVPGAAAAVQVLDCASHTPQNS